MNLSCTFAFKYRLVKMHKLNNQITQIMDLKYRAHPWHGIYVGDMAPEVVTAFIEIVPTDTVKYELDKESGFLKIDRPQRYSSVVPALYGFIPQSYCGEIFAEHCMKEINRTGISGDSDPLDICILTEKDIAHGDIIATVRPIGGFRVLDGSEADDKIIAILENDATYDNYTDISELPTVVLQRIKHYFLTYKDMPGEKRKNIEITHEYGREESYEVIRCCLEDYRNYIRAQFS